MAACVSRIIWSLEPRRLEASSTPSVANQTLLTGCSGLGEYQLFVEAELSKVSENMACMQPPCRLGAGSCGHTGEHTSGGWSQFSPSQVATALPDCGTKPGAHASTHVAP